MPPDYAFRPMTEAGARAVAAWRYDPPYDFYDMARDPEGLAGLEDPAQRRAYYAAHAGDALVGFFSFGASARVPGGAYPDGPLDVGLGLRPDLVGRGAGLGFVLAGLAFALERFGTEEFRLTVATFNERAIRVYERAGFNRREVFASEADGQPFLVMAREA